MRHDAPSTPRTPGRPGRQSAQQIVGSAPKQIGRVSRAQDPALNPQSLSARPGIRHASPAWSPKVSSDAATPRTPGTPQFNHIGASTPRMRFGAIPQGSSASVPPAVQKETNAPASPPQVRTRVVAPPEDAPDGPANVRSGLVALQSSAGFVAPKAERVAAVACVLSDAADSSPTRARYEDSRRHYVHGNMNPLLLGDLPAEEARPSRAMPYLKEEPKEEPTTESSWRDNAVWKRLGLFSRESPVKPARTSTSPSPGAPHRSSMGFLLAQQPPTQRELMAIKAKATSSREFESRGVTSYFENEYMPPPLSVRRSDDSRNTVAEGFLADDSDICSAATPGESYHAHEHTPWAVDVQAKENGASPAALWSTGGGVFGGVRCLKASPQSARRNQAGGPLEDGFVKTSDAESRQAALGLPIRNAQSPLAIANKVQSPPCWSQIRRSLPSSPKARPITDALPAYNAVETVRNVMDAIKELPPSSPATRTRRNLYAPLESCPYASIEDSPGVDSSWKRTASEPPPRRTGILAKSLMSSGHGDAINSTRFLELQQQVEVAPVPAIASSKQVGVVVCERHALYSAPTGLLAVEAAGIKATLPRSQSANSRIPRSCAIGDSPRKRLSCSQKNRAAVAYWSSELRQEISDRPWTSLKQEPGKTFGVLTGLALKDNASEDGGQSLALLDQSPIKVKTSVRKDIWQSRSSKQLNEVQDTMAKQCEDRINAYRQEMEDMTSRNAQMRKHIERFKMDAQATSPIVPAAAIQDEPCFHSRSTRQQMFQDVEQVFSTVESAFQSASASAMAMSQQFEAMVDTRAASDEAPAHTGVFKAASAVSTREPISAARLWEEDSYVPAAYIDEEDPVRAG